jgi:amino acid transporter
LINKGLKKEMTRLDLTMASLGAIIGSGWLFGSLYGANTAGPAAVFSWLIGGIAVLLIGLVYAELGGMLPESGGIARYPHYTHGSLTSFIMGWGAWIAYASVPAIEAEAVIGYAAHWAPGLMNAKGTAMSDLGLLIAALLMLLFFIINYYGVRLFARVNTTVTILKFIMPAVTILVFLFSGLHWGNLTSHGFAPDGTSGVLQAIATSGIVFSYLGFRQAVDLAGEAKNPQKDVPRAIITAIAIGIVLYTLLQLVFLGGVNPAALAKGWANLSFNAPFAQVATALNLGWLAMFLYADAILSPAGTGNIYTASTARVIYALANNKYFPKGLAKVDERTGIPRAALWVAFILGLLFLAPFPAWQTLVGLVSSATVFTYIIGPISAAALRRTHPDANRPYRLGGLNIIAPIAFVIGSLIVYWTGWTTDWKLLIALLVGVVLYFIFSAAMPEEIQKPDAASVKAGIWLIVYLLVMLAMSYFGSKNFGAPTNAIPYPWDLIVVIVLSLGFYYWGVGSALKTQATDEALEALQIQSGGPGFTA